MPKKARREYACSDHQIVGEVRPLFPDSYKCRLGCGATLKTSLDVQLHVCHRYYTGREYPLYAMGE